MDKPFIPGLSEHWAGKLKCSLPNKANMNHEINNFCFADNINLTCISPPTKKKQNNNPVAIGAAAL